MSGYELMPYQVVSDSPTQKYYTDWSRFEKFLRKPLAPSSGGFDAGILELLGIKPSTIVRATDKGGDPDFAEFEPTAVKLFSYHAASCSFATKIRASDDVAVLIEKPLTGVKSVHLEIEVLKNAHIVVMVLSPRNSEGLLTVSLKTHLGPGTSAELVNILVDSPNSSTAVFHRAALEREAALSSLNFILGGFADYLEESYIARGEKARLLVRGVLAAPTNSNVSLNTNTAQHGKQTEVTVKVFGFAADGVAVHKGLSTLKKGSESSKLRVESRLIPLTDRAKVFSAPMLEINSDEPAEASHSASHSPINPESLFYLRSRGVPEREAVRMILKGMVESLFLTSVDAEVSAAVKRLADIALTSTLQ